MIKKFPSSELMGINESPRALRSLKNKASIGSVSKATDISTSHLSRIFNGKRSPSLDVARKIANHLGCSVDDLMAAIDESAAMPDPRLASKAA